MAGKVVSVTSVKDIQAAFTERAASNGTASVMKAGVVCSVIKI